MSSTADTGIKGMEEIAGYAEDANGSSSLMVEIKAEDNLIEETPVILKIKEEDVKSVEVDIEGSSGNNDMKAYNDDPLLEEGRKVKMEIRQQDDEDDDTEDEEESDEDEGASEEISFASDSQGEILEETGVRISSAVGGLHEKDNSKPDYTCTCGKLFTSSTGLYIHHAKLTQVPKFSCQVCSKKFLYFSGLKRHQLSVHKGSYQWTEKQVGCSRCGKVFLDKHERRGHLNTRNETCKKGRGGSQEMYTTGTTVNGTTEVTNSSPGMEKLNHSTSSAGHFYNNQQSDLELTLPTCQIPITSPPFAYAMNCNIDSGSNAGVMKPPLMTCHGVIGVEHNNPQQWSRNQLNENFLPLVPQVFMQTRPGSSIANNVGPGSLNTARSSPLPVFRLHQPDDISNQCFSFVQKILRENQHLRNFKVHAQAKVKELDDANKSLREKVDVERSQHLEFKQAYSKLKERETSLREKVDVERSQQLELKQAYSKLKERETSLRKKMEGLQLEHKLQQEVFKAEYEQKIQELQADICNAFLKHAYLSRGSQNGMNLFDSDDDGENAETSPPNYILSELIKIKEAIRTSEKKADQKLTGITEQLNNLFNRDLKTHVDPTDGLVSHPQLTTNMNQENQEVEEETLMELNVVEAASPATPDRFMSCLPSSVDQEKNKHETTEDADYIVQRRHKPQRNTHLTNSCTKRNLEHCLENNENVDDLPPTLTLPARLAKENLRRPHSMPTLMPESFPLRERNRSNANGAEVNKLHIKKKRKVLSENREGLPTTLSKKPRTLRLGILATKKAKVLSFKKHGKDLSKPGYNCLCGSKFTGAGGLYVHFVKLTESEKFACGLCGKRFHYFSGLKAHRRATHSMQMTQEVGCSRCGQVFPCKSERQGHRDSRGRTCWLSGSYQSKDGGRRNDKNPTPVSS